MYESLPTAATSLRGNRGTQLDTFIRSTKFNVSQLARRQIIRGVCDTGVSRTANRDPSRTMVYSRKSAMSVCVRVCTRVVHRCPISYKRCTVRLETRRARPYYRATTAGLAFTANEIALIKQAAPKVPADAVNAALVVYPRDQMRSIIKEFT